MLLRWQTELLSVNALEIPAVGQLVANSTQIASSVERFAGVAEKLPGQVSREREEILKALEAQEMVNYAFWKAILLVVIVLAAALFYRLLVVRLTTRSKTTSP